MTENIKIEGDKELTDEEKDILKKKILENESPEKKMDRAEKDFEVKVNNNNITVENGHELIRILKKEAGRQKAMKVAQSLELQTRPADCLPLVESVSEEIDLADSFEIIEE